MKTLVVDDDFICRKVLVKFLSEYGECDIAVNGKEALNAFKQAYENKEKYDLICLDIMMPEINGQDALKKIRNFESENDISGLDCVKVIMTTALDDLENIKTAFREQCEAYIVKPVSKEIIVQKLKLLELIK